MCFWEFDLINEGMMTMYIIVGLGNPEDKYDKTRHNIGFDTIDYLANKYNISMDFMKHKAICGKGIIEGEKVILAKPITYMNLSGESVKELVNYYKVDREELIIIYDDIDLDVGNMRLRRKGSAGGHNGIKNIIAHLGTEEFNRVKIGVGAKPKGWDLVDHVLGRFSDEERVEVEKAIAKAAEACVTIMTEDMTYAMNEFNKK